MELGQYHLQIFVSLVAFPVATFVALTCDLRLSSGIPESTFRSHFVRAFVTQGFGS
jgi:hypothetical protein